MAYIQGGLIVLSEGRLHLRFGRELGGGGVYLEAFMF